MADFGIFNRIPEAIAAMELERNVLVVQAAYDMADAAVARAPVDTGFLRSSIYVETIMGSTYGQNLVGSGPMDPPINGDLDHGANSFVGCAASYAIYQEFGTRFQAGTPFLTPAYEEESQRFIDSWAALEAAMDVGL